MAVLQSICKGVTHQVSGLQEICLCDAPVVMALVDGPTGENDNNICVAYRHQFDLINESTGESYRLHHVEASRVSSVTNQRDRNNRHSMCENAVL